MSRAATADHGRFTCVELIDGRQINRQNAEASRPFSVPPKQLCVNRVIELNSSTELDELCCCVVQSCDLPQGFPLNTQLIIDSVL
jgi:hypothetical protein